MLRNGGGKICKNVYGLRVLKKNMFPSGVPSYYQNTRILTLASPHVLECNIPVARMRAHHLPFVSGGGAQSRAKLALR